MPNSEINIASLIGSLTANKKIKVQEYPYWFKVNAAGTAVLGYQVEPSGIATVVSFASVLPNPPAAGWVYEPVYNDDTILDAVAGQAAGFIKDTTDAKKIKCGTT